MMNNWKSCSIKMHHIFDSLSIISISLAPSSFSDNSTPTFIFHFRLDNFGIQEETATTRKRTCTQWISIQTTKWLYILSLYLHIKNFLCIWGSLHSSYHVSLSQRLTNLTLGINDPNLYHIWDEQSSFCVCFYINSQ